MQVLKINDIIDKNNISVQEIYSVLVGNKSILLHYDGNEWYAFAQKCPHGGTLLTEGYIDAKNCIVCPTHFYKFSLQTGKEFLGREYRLKLYKTFILNSEWYVEI